MPRIIGCFFLFICIFFLWFLGNVQSQQVWGVSWHEACDAGLQRCTGELLICLLVFWISNLTANMSATPAGGWGVGLQWSVGRCGGGESNHGGVWRTVAHRRLSAIVVGANTAKQNCTEGATNTNKPLDATRGGRWDRHAGSASTMICIKAVDPHIGRSNILIHLTSWCLSVCYCFTTESP